MSELAPAEIKLLPDSVTDSHSYVQKTSLAADKQVTFSSAVYDRYDDQVSIVCIVSSICN